MITEEQKRKAVELFDDGCNVAQVAEQTGIPLNVVERKHGEWISEASGSRFVMTVDRVITPSEKLKQKMPAAMKKLDEGDVHGFLESMAPIAAMQMARDSVMCTSETVRHSAQKDILDRAGYKPKQQVELYTKYDSMQKDELIAAIRGAMMDNPKFAVKLLEIKKEADNGGISVVKKLTPDVVDVDIVEMSESAQDEFEKAEVDLDFEQ